VKAHGDRAVAPRVVELMTAIRREDEVDAKALRRVVERAELIAGGGGKEENTHSRRS
jgi:hypothetical protein